MTTTLVLTLLEVLLAGAGVLGAYVLGSRVERDQVARDIRRGRLIVVPDELVANRDALGCYLDEIEAWS